MDINNKIKKYIKSYLCGIKIISDKKYKTLDYFNKCILIYKDINLNKVDDEKKTIINDIYNKINKYRVLLKDNLFDLIDKGDIININKYYNLNDFYIYNNEGFTPMHYAIKNGDTLFLKYAFGLGVDIDTPNKQNGYTLLEYACILGDPNMINFMILNGANIKKHQEFRTNCKYYNQNKQIDYNLIIKYLIINNNKEKNGTSLSFIFDYISPTYTIGLDDITINELVLYIEDFLLKIPILSKQSFINILKEELQYDLINSIYCPNNKLEIILYNIVPFLKDFSFNLSLRWLIQLEIKYLYYKLNDKKLVLEKINNIYIKTYLLPNDFIQNLISK
jgi:hypothetical protein